MVQPEGAKRKKRTMVSPKFSTRSLKIFVSFYSLQEGTRYKHFSDLYLTSFVRKRDDLNISLVVKLAEVIFCHLQNIQRKVTLELLEFFSCLNLSKVDFKTYASVPKL